MAVLHFLRLNLHLSKQPGGYPHGKVEVIIKSKYKL